MNTENLKMKNTKQKIPSTYVDRIFALAEKEGFEPSRQCLASLLP